MKTAARVLLTWRSSERLPLTRPAGGTESTALYKLGMYLERIQCSAKQPIVAQRQADVAIARVEGARLIAIGRSRVLAGRELVV
jgi:hypothetical protein